MVAGAGTIGGWNIWSKPGISLSVCKFQVSPHGLSPKVGLGPLTLW